MDSGQLKHTIVDERSKRASSWNAHLFQYVKSEFYCLYLHGCYYSSKMMETVLEVIDFMADKTYYMNGTNSRPRPIGSFFISDP